MTRDVGLRRRWWGLRHEDRTVTRSGVSVGLLHPPTRIPSPTVVPYVSGTAVSPTGDVSRPVSGTPLVTRDSSMRTRPPDVAGSSPRTPSLLPPSPVSFPLLSCPFHPCSLTPPPVRPLSCPSSPLPSLLCCPTSNLQHHLPSFLFSFPSFPYFSPFLLLPSFLFGKSVKADRDRLRLYSRVNVSQEEEEVRRVIEILTVTEVHRCQGGVDVGFRVWDDDHRETPCSRSSRAYGSEKDTLSFFGTTTT